MESDILSGLARYGE